MFLVIDPCLDSRFGSSVGLIHHPQVASFVSHFLLPSSYTPQPSIATPENRSDAQGRAPRGAAQGPSYDAQRRRGPSRGQALRPVGRRADRLRGARGPDGPALLHRAISRPRGRPCGGQSQEGARPLSRPGGAQRAQARTGDEGASRAAVPTLRRAFESYLAARPRLAPQSRAKYLQRLHSHMPDWLERRLDSIARTDIEERFGALSTGEGPAGQGGGPVAARRRAHRPFEDGSFPGVAIAGPIATYTGGTPTSASTPARRSGSTPVATASSRWLSAT